MSLRAEIRYRLDYLLVPDRLKRVEGLKLKIEELERERAELRQRIPLWDRVAFFKTTPDESRVQAIGTKLEPCRAVLRELREEVTLRLAKVGKEFPPFAIGTAIERSFKLARDQLVVEGHVLKHVAERDTLHAALAAMADRVLEVWVPDFALEPLFAALADEAMCRRAASRGDDRGGRQPEPHDRLGVSPISSQALVPLVARRLLEGDFFAEQQRLAELEAARAALSASYDEAAAGVSLLDKVKVFSVSPAQTARDSVRARLAQTERALKRCYEKTRRLLHQALAAYPPLAVYQRVVEVMGVVAQLGVSEEPNIDGEGRVTAEPVVSGRALVFAALRRLLETFMEVFPDVPLPIAIAMELTDGTALRTLSPRMLLTREFHTRHDRSWARTLREESLAHAAMQGSLTRRLERVSAQIGLFDRIIFFVDSAKEQQKDELERRAAWHRAEGARLWKDLLKVARITGGELAPLAARDLAIKACRQLSDVRTDDGTSGRPMDCAVHGREHVIATLSEIGEILRSHYDLRGTRAEMIAEVAGHPSTKLGDETPTGRFQPLDHAEVVRRLAHNLAGTRFVESFERLQTLREGFAPSSFDEEVLGERVSLWDKINVFTSTPEESERDELRGELAKVDAAVREALETVDGLFQQALADVYPPAIVCYSIGGARSAVHAIRAECRSRIFTSGSGRNKRSETRYSCGLNGKSAATSALRGWCANLVRTFGQLPGYHALLEEGELGGILDAGWAWGGEEED